MKTTSQIPGALFPVEKKDLKQNLISGFIIFLVALPLSIGISVASGAPASAGILAAIVGGILGSIVSGSYVTISGPAAGLIVVILESVVALGHGDNMLGFRLTLAAIVCAGFIQIGLGLLRAGTLALSVPVNALHGMLASIGVTIMTKQIFVMEGIAPKEKTIFMQIFEIPGRLADNNYEIFMIGLICLGAVILFNVFPKLNKYLPAPLVAVIIGYIFSYVIDLEHTHTISIFHHDFEIGPKFLLRVPENIQAYFVFPLFEGIGTHEFIQSVITIALVGSIESLLSTYAVEKLDPLKRPSNLNMDLISKGLCNTLLGFVGGIPVISEIVRSSANVSNGATSRWSNFFHGAFILLFILSVPFLLNKIPLTAFAAILVFVGFRLANPKQLAHVYHSGVDQLIIFLVTLVVTLNTDLLIGIFTGAALELLINAARAKDFIALFKLRSTTESQTNSDKITVTGPCVFTNMLFLKSKIEKSEKSNVDVTFAKDVFVDFSSREILSNVKNQMALQNKKVVFHGIHIGESAAH